MTDPLRGRATAFLLRIGLLAGLLAIIAGIVGMHVMAGGHSMHATPVVSQSAVVSQSHGAHTHAERASLLDEAAVQHATSSPAAPCTCPGTCTGMSALHAVCVPAPGHNTLTAPLPGVPPYANAGTAGGGVLVSGYSHRPGSPSPGDLCISRT
ncbi:hypothetical protein [Arthrobacter sp. efr-133-R2A-120]|uniref:hypothetical protein n=1 Tax=Arthrobacter sp. efr-133-R2A-120 TaxID=3040277 RepID=UPI0025519537|nr:hypothetical protein [Arthrobacter sp. efr-133-R2A-120]